MRMGSVIDAISFKIGTVLGRPFVPFCQPSEARQSSPFLTSCVNAIGNIDSKFRLNSLWQPDFEAGGRVTSNYLRVRADLERIGFRQISNTDFFEREMTVIGLDIWGQPTWYEDYPLRTSADEIIVIGRYEGYDHLYLAYSYKWLEHDGEEKLYVMYDSVGNVDDRLIDRKKFEKRRESIPQQLLKAGFVRDSIHRNIFRLHMPSKLETPRTAVAIVRYGNIDRLLLTTREGVQKKLGSNVQFVAARRVKDEFLVTFRTPFFEVDTKKGWVTEQRPLLSLEDYPLEELGIQFFKETVDPKTGFKVGGVNATEVIRNLKSINDIPVEELQADMKPWPSMDSAHSMHGFLGQDDFLLDTMATDNDDVLERDLNHQLLAKPLRYMVASAIKDCRRVVYKGVVYELDLGGSQGIQHSPFRDDTGTTCDLTVRNIETGKEIKFSLLLVDMIERYGFYEGKGTSYRLEPSDIIEIFNLHM